MTWDDLLADPPTDPAPNPYRPHCDKCGRFVRQASVRTITHWEGLDEDQFGHCSVCGEVGVTWALSAPARVLPTTKEDGDD